MNPQSCNSLPVSHDHTDHTECEHYPRSSLTLLFSSPSPEDLENGWGVHPACSLLGIWTGFW